MISAGDTTQNGYKSTEWEVCFEVMGDYYAKYPTVTVAGNHDEGRLEFRIVRTALQYVGAKIGYPQFDRTMGYFEYGDAIFVILNGEVTRRIRRPRSGRKSSSGARACWMLPTRNGASL